MHEKNTQTSQPHVEEECVLNQEPPCSNIDAVGTIDYVEKIQRNSDSDSCANEELEDQLDEDNEAENEAEECVQEVERGAMAHTPETAQKEAFVLNTNSSGPNDKKNTSPGNDSKKNKPAATKRILAVDGEMFFVSKGMEKKFGFKKMVKAGR